MTITLETVESLAPDQASVKAANKLLKPAKWPLLGIDAERQIIWGECQGSGANPYRISFSLSDHGYKCSCPSRKFPCKHVLCVMWQYAETPTVFEESAAPQWVEDWLSRRRGLKKTDGKDEAGKTKSKVSICAAKLVVDEKPEDPKALERKRALAEKRKAEREASVLAGLEELENWLADQVSSGVSGFASVAGERCRLAAQRLVDAKAPGLASWVDEIPSRYFSTEEEFRPDFLLEEFGKLYLMVEAYRKQGQLPEDLRQDVRRIAGWQIKRDELLEDKSAKRVSGSWVVLRVHDEVQADQLRRYETWLWNFDTRGSQFGESQFAVLIDFVPVSAGTAAPPFVQGEMFQGELVYYPSAYPMRAVINERKTAGDGEADFSKLSGKGYGVADVLEAYRDAVVEMPWVDRMPSVLLQVRLSRAEGGYFLLVEGDDERSLPVSNRRVDGMIPLMAAGAIDCIGLWDGRAFELFAAKSDWGWWYYS